MTEFYVYTHAKPDGGVFYVGKGKGRRAYNLALRNTWHKRITAKYGEENITVNVVPCTDEDAAFTMEKWLINMYRVLGAKLCNMTDGGEGVSGLVHTDDARAKISYASTGNQHNLGHKQSAEHRAKISASHTGKTLSAETRAKMRKPKSDEHRDKIRVAKQNMSAETRAKMRIAARLREAKKKILSNQA